MMQMDWTNGLLSAGAQVRESVKTLGQLCGIFANEEARRAMNPQTIVYRVQAWCPLPDGTQGGLFWGSRRSQLGTCNRRRLRMNPKAIPDPLHQSNAEDTEFFCMRGLPGVSGRMSGIAVLLGTGFALAMNARPASDTRVCSTPGYFIDATEKLGVHLRHQASPNGKKYFVP
jgi:hypothetical protein